jgi:hypothetical protein
MQVATQQPINRVSTPYLFLRVQAKVLLFIEALSFEIDGRGEIDDHVRRSAELMLSQLCYHPLDLLDRAAPASNGPALGLAC